MDPPRPAQAVQDAYPDEFAHCYGCGRLNEKGLHIRSFVEGADVVAAITPRADQVAVPGFVYGGFIASVLDCHMIAAAAAAAQAADKGEMRRFVTANLKVEFQKPTPVGVPLELRARGTPVSARKVSVEGTLSAAGIVRARGELLAAEMPASMGGHGRAP